MNIFTSIFSKKLPLTKGGNFVLKRLWKISLDLINSDWGSIILASDKLWIYFLHKMKLWNLSPITYIAFSLVKDLLMASMNQEEWLEQVSVFISAPDCCFKTNLWTYPSSVATTHCKKKKSKSTYVLPGK